MQANTRSSGLRFGPYVTPVVVEGAVVECEVRGLVRIVGISDAPIPWPIGERDGQSELVVFKALARAVRQETPHDVAAQWGISAAAVEQWKALCGGPRRRKKQTAANPPIRWKPHEDELLSRMSLADAARLTGRTLTAVRKRRRTLGLPDGRLASYKAERRGALAQRADTAYRLMRTRTEELLRSLSALRLTFNKSKASLAFWRSQARRNAAGERTTT